MTDEAHPNYVKRYEVTPELLDQMYARTAQQLLDQKAAERRAQEWPGQVEQLLATMAAKVVALESRVAELEAGRG